MEGTAEEYEKSCPEILSRYAASSVDLHFPAMKWSEEDVILDIGCGPGRTTRNILLPKCPKVKKIVAVDINPGYVEYARKTYFHEKIEFRMRNVFERLESTEIEKYDKVVSFYVFHFINDLENLFSVVSSLLKPGGHFFFVLITKQPSYSVRREPSTDREWTEYIKTEDMLDTIPPTDDWKDVESEFKNYVFRFGSRVTKSKCDVLDVPFSDKKQFLDLLLAVSPKAIFENMEPDVKQRLWRRVEPIIRHAAGKR
ncbi:juvenile hormone acid O-methyltransferase-like [Centruroides sculpturatus]|uniref:juvenile hormone acid O-methyltransferase-like n=1 Tax=Centruroides sculpturatus TaxID=218467 RepID=UPI000C6E1500|nr:juvenile hormone acid O-methyltransferase-like [Centruroides sculpturatus]